MNEDSGDENEFLRRCGDGDDDDEVAGGDDVDLDRYLAARKSTELRISHDSTSFFSVEEEFDSDSDSSVDDFFNNETIGTAFSQTISQHEDHDQNPSVMIRPNRYDLSRVKECEDYDDTGYGESSRNSHDFIEKDQGHGQDEGETVRRLVQSVHERGVHVRALELQFNHSQLQLQALITREQEVRLERDTLQYTVAEAEQDKLLLEAKLRDVVSFEQGGSGRGQEGLLKSIRDKLLNAANGKISDLVSTLGAEQRRAEEEGVASEQALLHKTSEVAALREELRHLSDQLAHRTVLYSAQDRRWKDSMRSHLSLQTEQSRDLLTARARLQQLEHTYERTDRERLEAVMSSRQLSSQVENLNLILADQGERTILLDCELAEVTASAVGLQATVDRLRGADMDELERDMALEVEGIRADAREREEILQRQVEDCMFRLGQEAERREGLLDELESLRSRLSNRKYLNTDPKTRF
jgi:hypothetical protein